MVYTHLFVNGLISPGLLNYLFTCSLAHVCVIKMKMKILIEDIIPNKNKHLGNFLEGQNSYIFIKFFII